MTKTILLYVMIVFYVLAGMNHFLRPDVYLPMMPPFLSGVAEVGLGLALLISPLRSAAAWGMIAMLIAIFPANLHIALHDVPLFGRTEGFGVWNWVRLPFQGVLIAWAWWYTRDGEAPRLTAARALRA